MNLHAVKFYGELAQLGEHLPCTQGVKGSSPLFSTRTTVLEMYLENRITCIKQTQKKNEIEILKLSESLKDLQRVIYDFNRENQNFSLSF